MLTKEQIEREREAFEGFMIEIDTSVMLDKTMTENPTYLDKNVEWAWQAVLWRAERAADERKAERERCAGVCETEIWNCCWEGDSIEAANHIAETIRALGD